MVHARSAGAYAFLAGEPVAAELSSWLDVIAEITRAATRDSALEELMELIAGATARLTGYDFCAVFVADSERQALIIRGSYGHSPEYVDSINARTPVQLRAGDSGEGPSSRAFRSQRPTTVLDIAADPPSRAWETVAAQQGYSSLLAVPLVVGRTHFGLINCYTAEQHEFSAHEIILMESMANQAGLAIETAQLLAEGRDRTKAAQGRAAALAADLAVQQQADDDHRELLRVVLRGGGLGAIAESLAAMFGCTVVVEDETGRIVASADGQERNRSGAGPREPRIPESYRQARAALAATPDSGAVTVPPGGDPAGTGGIVVPILVEEETAGLLWALAPAEPFGTPQRRAVTRAAAVAALALLRERTAQEVEWRLSRDFFDDLFDADGQSNEALHGRARQLGADLARPHTVLIIRRDPALPGAGGVHEEREAYAQRSLLTLVQRTAAAERGATLTATRSDHVVVLWDDDSSRSPRDFAEHLRREILAYAGSWTATVSVGPSCREVREYGDPYRLACSALDLVQQCERGSRVVSLDSIGAYRLLLQVKRPRELQSFAESTLGRVREYDRRHQTKLGATLTGYMAHRCNVSATANALHVHPNTVSYRLRRVEEILDLDLADPQALLHLQLALMIESVLGD